MSDYPDTQLFVEGCWTDATDAARQDVINPATGSVIGSVAMAARPDVEAAVESAARALPAWAATSALERARILTTAAKLLRDRSDAIGRVMTMEQGKPLRESTAEVLVAAAVLDWLAGEAPRTYGRVIPARSVDVRQSTVREPVGVVAAFAPWNFPINQVVRKIGAALAAGCTLVVKPDAETPASPAALIAALVDAGLPAGVLNLIYGDPEMVSTTLIPHPRTAKISFTGSTLVGKRLAALAGQHMKRATMELGGHAPVIVAADADLDVALNTMVAAKYRNAGQVCVAPTRFLVHQSVYERFVTEFAAAAARLAVGDGLDQRTQMGPLANERRAQAAAHLVQDAVRHGARLVTGGRRLERDGVYFQPTVLGEVSVEALAMNDEPFAPIALMRPFDDLAEAVAEANRLRYALASYAFTRSSATAHTIARDVRAGMLSINHAGLALPETPNGGFQDSGYGYEGGTEAVEPYLVTKFVTHRIVE